MDVNELIRLLSTIQDLEEAGKTTVKTAKKVGKQTKAIAKKAKRAPSAYNQYMKKTLAALKKKHPKTAHTVLFKRAAKSWKRSPEYRRSKK